MADHVGQQLPEYAEREIKRNAEGIMKYYCQAGELIYCDKSLDNAQHLAAVRRTFDDAKYVIIVRHVMDTIASGLEASPWGFDAFGYSPFVRESLDNTVAALARYWEMQVSLALRWLKEMPSDCHLLRYEALVTEPDAVLGRLFEFLDVSKEVNVREGAFRRLSGKDGPGDYKVLYTDSVRAGSVGRGKRVPVDRIPPPLMQRVNELLGQVGYPAVTYDWNIEPNVSEVAPSRLGAELRRLLGSGHLVEELGVDAVAIIADDDVTLRWIIDGRLGSVQAGDGEVDVVIAGATSDLLHMFRRADNVAALMRAGRIRVVPADPEVRQRLDVAIMVKKLLNGIGGGDGNGHVDS